MSCLQQYLLPKKMITLLMGLLANCKLPWLKNFFIQHFIQQYAVDMRLALEEEPTAYPCFNDFFIRHLKPNLRPVSSTGLVSPVDGVLSQFGRLDKGVFIQAKGHQYLIDELLACEKSEAEIFHCGQFATFYLSPKDYHRIHMPIDGQLQKMIYVPGQLFSVQPATAKGIPKLFARNERLVIFFDTPLGSMAMILVGAVIVGAMNTVWHGDVQRCKKRKVFDYRTANNAQWILSRGEEMGHFKLGSTVILAFAEGHRITWLPTLGTGSEVIFGQKLADIMLK